MTPEGPVQLGLMMEKLTEVMTNLLTAIKALPSVFMVKPRRTRTFTPWRSKPDFFSPEFKDLEFPASVEGEAG
jgi:hypothetical protein